MSLENSSLKNGPYNMSLKTLRTPEEAAIRWLVHLDSPRLSTQQEKAFFAWLNSSPKNQAAYLKIERLSQRGKVLGQRVKHSPEQVSKRAYGVLQWQGWAVACFLLISIGYFLTSLTPTSPERYEFQTAIGEQQTHTLSDGSTIWLNTNSHLQFTQEADKRTAYLQRGEAFFDIQTDAKHPFEVVTDAGRIRVIGTQFSVQKTSNDSIITVMEGKVALASGLSLTDEFTADSTLIANQRHTLKSANEGTAPERLDASIALAWREKQLIYRGESFGVVINDLNRYFKENIFIDDESLKEKSVIAVLRIDSLDSAISTLSISLNLTPQFNQDRSSITFHSK